jgi:DNA repair exonuclease SbcCD ATPase subunit
MDDAKTEISEQASGEIEPSEPPEVDPAIIQEVQEIKEAVNGMVSETALSDKVEELRTNLENISEEVQSWRTWQKDIYAGVLETLKSQVDEIESEWDNVSTTMKAQREKLETLLQSFPGVIETSTLRALSLRVTHLERLVSELVGESNAKSTTARARKQLIISLAALGVTVVLWGIFLVLNLIK